MEKSYFDSQSRAYRQEDGLGNALVEISYVDPNTRGVIENGVTMTDTYEWVNGEPWGYVAWGGNLEPDGGNEDCVRIRPDAGPANDWWADIGCTTTFEQAWCEGTPPR